MGYKYELSDDELVERLQDIKDILDLIKKTLKINTKEEFEKEFNENQLEENEPRFKGHLKGK